MVSTTMDRCIGLTPDDRIGRPPKVLTNIAVAHSAITRKLNQ